MAKKRNLNLDNESGIMEAKPLTELYHYGELDAPIVVICDIPPQTSWSVEIPIQRNHLQLFLEIAQKFGFTAEDFCFIPCCPPADKETQASKSKLGKYLAEYRPSFLAKLAQTNPKVVLYLGATAGQQLAGRAVLITKSRGSFQQYDKVNVPVLPLFSLGYLFRFPENKTIFESDFIMLKKLKTSDWQLATINAGSEFTYEWREDISDIIEILRNGSAKVIAVDTETTGLAWMTNNVHAITIQLSYKEGHAICCSVDSGYRPTTKSLIAQWKELLEDPTILKVGHNLKFDNHILRKLGINVKGWIFDTQLMAFAIDENMVNKSLDECVRRWVPAMAGYADKFNQEVDKSNMMAVSYEQMLPYACGDVDACLRLCKVLYELLKQDKRQYNCYKRIMLPGILAFGNTVEKYGIKVDETALDLLAIEFKEQIDKIYPELMAEVPVAVKLKHLAQAEKHNDKYTRENPEHHLRFSRDDFVRDILFTSDGFGLTPTVFTATTRNLPVAERVPSVSAGDHLPYFEDHDWVNKYIEHAKLDKLLTTYVGLRQDPNKNNQPTGFYQHIRSGVIHPSYRLDKTVTGRTSSQDPNGQNIPKRGKYAKTYRKIFVARPGYVLLEADLSQAELRIAAWMANEKNMIRLYKKGKDIHKVVGSAIYYINEIDFSEGVTFAMLEKLLEQFETLPKEVQKLYRQYAKAVNFGFLYGMGWRKFVKYAKTSYQVVVTDQQAEAFREMFFAMFPGLRIWHANMRQFVKKYGYVRALHGALRRLPSVNSSEDGVKAEAERQSINSPVQRFASDIGVCAMIRFARDANEEDMRPVAFIHDALVIEAKESHVEEAASAVKFYMQSVPFKEWFDIEPPLPIVSDVSVGINLGEMEERPDVVAKAPSWYKPDRDLK